MVLCAACGDTRTDREPAPAPVVDTPAPVAVRDASPDASPDATAIDATPARVEPARWESMTVALTPSPVGGLRVVQRRFLDEYGLALAVRRRFRQDGRTLLLAVRGDTLESMVFAADKLAAAYRLDESTADGTSAYERALRATTAAPFPVHNDGLIAGRGKGLYLSVDLCPTNRGAQFEKRLFEAAMAMDSQPPVPVAIAVTGLWMRQHAKHFAWLLERQRAGDLAITWVGHSYRHRTHRDGRALERNFMLAPSVDASREILRTERMLLERGQVPSVFFRFPGLVSSEALLVRLRDQFGLIAVGTNAWVAKVDRLEPGSILLIHGNGHEPGGVDRFLQFIGEWRAQGAMPRLRPLREAALTALEVPP